MEQENVSNEFDNLMEDEVPQAEPQGVPTNSNEEELTPESLSRSESYIKTPNVGESITLEVEKVVNNNQVKGKNKETGEEFDIGCKRKDGTVVRRDIITPEGRYTIKNWGIFYALFGQEGVITKYAKEKGTFKGLKIKITKNYNGNYAMKPTEEVMKLMDIDKEKAEEYKKEVGKAIKDGTLYTVEKVE